MTLPNSYFPLANKLGLCEGQRVRFITGDLSEDPPGESWAGLVLVTAQLFRRPGDPLLDGPTIGTGTIKLIFLTLDVECVSVDADVPGAMRTVQHHIYLGWDHIEVIE